MAVRVRSLLDPVDRFAILPCLFVKLSTFVQLLLLFASLFILVFLPLSEYKLKLIQHANFRQLMSIVMFIRAFLVKTNR